MKLKRPLFLVSICISFLGFSQYDEDKQTIYLGPTNFTIGSTNGIHPNFDNFGFGHFINGHLEQSFRIKNVPLKFIGHLSNEELRIGRPSYFRISYDASVGKRLSKLNLRSQQFETNEILLKSQKDLFNLEGKLSYKNEMLRKLNSKLKLTQPEFNLPNVEFDSLGNPIENLELDKLNQVKYLDSLSVSIEDLASKISSQKELVDSLQLKMDDLKKMNISSYIPQKFKIEMASIGLTSMSKGGLSHNTIPIHGIHLEGEYRNTFYDLSAGLTQPFQNFTSQVFNQITSNTQNVFNLDQFFQTNRMKLVESAIVGYGDKYRSNIKAEHFYTGKSLEAIKNRTQQPTSNTINLSGNYNDKIIRNLNLGFLVGLSVLSNDSIEKKTGASNLAYRGTVQYKLKRVNGQIESEYRSLGNAYDGVSQGVLINGTTHKMIGYAQKIGRHSSTSLRYMEDSFSKTDSVVLFNSSKRILSQLNIRINRNNKVQGSYSMLLGSGTEVENRKGHMGTLFYANEVKIGKNRLTNIAQGGYTIIPVRLSDQEILQGSLSSQFSTEKFSYALKGIFEEYRGIEQLYGKNYILEPSIAYKGDMGEISATYQYCKSDQFETDHGFIFRANFTPSQFISYQVTGQKWLKKERNFFFIQAPSFVAPWYIDIRVTIHLNVRK